MVKYSYQFDGEAIEQGKTKTVFLTITYKNEIPADAQFDANLTYHFDNAATITIDLSEPTA